MSGAKEKVYIKGMIVTDKPVMFQKAMERLLELYAEKGGDYEIDFPTTESEETENGRRTKR